MNRVAVTAVVETAEFRKEILGLPITGMIFEALVVDGLRAPELVNPNHQRAEILKGADRPQIQNYQTERSQAEQGDGDLEVVVGDHRVAVLLQVELFRFVEYRISHDMKYAMMSVEDSPDKPLNMWLVNAGTLSSA